ncbi:Hypothetical_protein [Hexamita inflata]|uniref:Hypothetical_protein n=1 Tax=Hexamita inflata TaxID=28002 RepID=A0AA86PNB0_9EUKA|nr:Hypothetical protein HINF_LOCUS30799 [Hexamita inflata]
MKISFQNVPVIEVIDETECVIFCSENNIFKYSNIVYNFNCNQDIQFRKQKYQKYLNNFTNNLKFQNYQVVQFFIHIIIFHATPLIEFDKIAQSICKTSFVQIKIDEELVKQMNPLLKKQPTTIPTFETERCTN